MLNVNETQLTIFIENENTKKIDKLYHKLDEYQENHLDSDIFYINQSDDDIIIEIWTDKQHTNTKTIEDIEEIVNNIYPEEEYEIVYRIEGEISETFVSNDATFINSVYINTHDNDDSIYNDKLNELSNLIESTRDYDIYDKKEVLDALRKYFDEPDAKLEELLEKVKKIYKNNNIDFYYGIYEPLSLHDMIKKFKGV